jgi:hypothetical protein
MWHGRLRASRLIPAVVFNREKNAVESTRTTTVTILTRFGDIA